MKMIIMLIIGVIVMVITAVLMLLMYVGYGIERMFKDVDLGMYCDSVDNNSTNKYKGDKYE